MNIQSMMRFSVFASCTLLVSPPTLWAQEPQTPASCVFFERYSDWPEDLKIAGSILITDSLDGLQQYFATNDFSQSTLRQLALVGPYDSAQTVLNGPATRRHANSLTKIRWVPKIDLIESLDADTFLILCDDRPAHQIPPGDWQAIGQTIKEHLAKGAMAGFVGPACAALGKRYIHPDQGGELQNGLGLIPDAIVDFTASGDCDRSVCNSIERNHQGVLLTIAHGNAWVLQGRKARLYGPGAATAWVGSCEHLLEGSQRIEARSERNRNQPEEFLLDWTQWRRLAIERTLEAFPPIDKQIPHVANGSLIIVGGGGMPPGLMNKFVELAGGNESKIVYVPCAEEEDMSSDSRLLEVWKQMGAQSCSLVHTKDRKVANQDDKFLEPLKDATGIWFGGGRQWNLADSYYGTQAHRLMKQVLDRGGVIGGSSAGASIQGNYLARATPIENFRIMAPGYERGGLGFLSGVAIDQHFTQRRRQKDLVSLVETYPQILGIGIDESTAILVRKSTAEIIGPGKVTFNWKNETDTDLHEFVGADGQWFDMAGRKRVEPNEVPEVE